MDYFLIPGWVHALLLFVMIVLILTGRRNGVHLQVRRMRAEQATLRAAFIAELGALRAVYRLNLDLIAAGAPQLVSGRPYFSNYRGNMHRMLLLTPPEVAAIVTAHAACDTLDAAVQIGMRMRARHAGTAIWDARGLDVWRLQRAARTTVDDALAELEAALEASDAAARRTLWQRFTAWARGGKTGRDVALSPARTLEAGT